ncbi:hypothetical protein [Larkinella rosea]|nr:hypothetical protein [Larkinella rosea]
MNTSNGPNRPIGARLFLSTALTRRSFENHYTVGNGPVLVHFNP